MNVHPPKQWSEVKEKVRNLLTKAFCPKREFPKVISPHKKKTKSREHTRFFETNPTTNTTSYTFGRSITEQCVGTKAFPEVHKENRT